MQEEKYATRKLFSARHVRQQRKGGVEPLQPSGELLAAAGL
jgi:hypothetical protein